MRWFIINGGRNSKCPVQVMKKTPWFPRKPSGVSLVSNTSAKRFPMNVFGPDLKAKLFTQPYKTLEAMQAKVTEILENYSDAAVVKLTQFSHFINAANAV